MKATVLLTTLILAALLYDDGYRTLPIFLISIASLEGFLEPAWQRFKAQRRIATKLRRARDNISDGDVFKIKYELMRIPFILKYGSDESQERENERT